MRTVAVAIGFCLVNLVMAQAYGQAAAESITPVRPMVYGLVAAVGEEFNVVSAKPSIGSHLSPYGRSTIEVPDNILNRFALHGLDKAIANIDPQSKPFFYIEVWILDPKTLAVLDKQERFDNQKLADPRARILDISQNENGEFLASRVNSLIELSVGDAVMHSEINHRGRVEVGEPKVVNPGDANK